MAYATDILSKCVDETKELFFPIRKEYWLRMGFISLFSGRGGGSGNGSNSSSRSNGGNPEFSQAMSDFFSKVSDFFSQYSFLIAVGILVLYLVSLFFTYLNSVFTFVFIEGIIKKKVTIKKGFKDNKTLGVSLFSLRFIMGIVTLIIFLIIGAPVIYHLIMGTMADFNLWLILPMGLALLLFAIPLGIFWFLVYDFVVPMMYLKKSSFVTAWHRFKKNARNKKMEIFIYWLVKIGISIAMGIASLFLMIPLLLALIIIGIPIVLVGLAIYFLVNLISTTAAIVLVSILGFIVLLLVIYAFSVIFVPFRAFIVKYSLEMVKKLKL